MAASNIKVTVKFFSQLTDRVVRITFLGFHFFVGVCVDACFVLFFQIIADTSPFWRNYTKEKKSSQAELVWHSILQHRHSQDLYSKKYSVFFGQGTETPGQCHKWSRRFKSNWVLVCISETVTMLKQWCVVPCEFCYIIVI